MSHRTALVFALLAALGCDCEKMLAVRTKRPERPPEKLAPKAVQRGFERMRQQEAEPPPAEPPAAEQFVATPPAPGALPVPVTAAPAPAPPKIDAIAERAPEAPPEQLPSDPPADTEEPAVDRATLPVAGPGPVRQLRPIKFPGGLRGAPGLPGNIRLNPAIDSATKGKRDLQ